MALIFYQEIRWLRAYEPEDNETGQEARYRRYGVYFTRCFVELSQGFDADNTSDMQIFKQR